MGLSWSAARRFSSTAKLNAAAINLATHLRKLQSQAIAQHQIIALDAQKFGLPSGISLASPSTIAFAPSGFTSFGGSGTIVIKNNLGTTKKVIVSTIGRVRIE